MSASTQEPTSRITSGIAIEDLRIGLGRNRVRNRVGCADHTGQGRVVRRPQRDFWPACWRFV